MMKKNFKNKKGLARIVKQGGFTMIEVLFYISIFAVLSVVIINALIVMTKAFKENTIQSDIVKSSSIAERIEREIKQAISVASISPTQLRLNTTDESGATKTVQFTLSGTSIVLVENDITTGNLNLPNISVSNVSFTQITTADGRAVKFSLNVSSTRDAQSRVFTFNDTGVLRGSY